MLKKGKRVACCALAATGLMVSSESRAETVSANGTAVFAVVNLCSVTGASIDLGINGSVQPLADVAAAQGWYLSGSRGGTVGTGINSGMQGFAYASFGSVTCDAGMPYSVLITGNGQFNSAQLRIDGAMSRFLLAVKKLGGAEVPDNAGPDFAGSGHQMAFGALPGTGTGAAQVLVGSAVLDLDTSAVMTSRSNGPARSAGAYSDKLTYTLVF